MQDAKWAKKNLNRKNMINVICVWNDFENPTAVDEKNPLKISKKQSDTVERNETRPAADTQ